MQYSSKEHNFYWKIEWQKEIYTVLQFKDICVVQAWYKSFNSTQPRFNVASSSSLKGQSDKKKYCKLWHWNYMLQLILV